MFDAEHAPAVEAAQAHPAPKARKLPTYRRTCSECAAEFKANDRKAQFCCDRHKNAWRNRSMKRGAIMVPLILTWRGGRGQREAARWAYGELCRLADQWNREDRAAGRKPMADYLLPKMRGGWSAADVAPEAGH